MLGANDLNEEKKRVKNELKRYDNCFNAEYKRYPDRREKEPMRPLYLYYKRLKQAISRVPKMKDAALEKLNDNKGQIVKNDKNPSSYASNQNSNNEISKQALEVKKDSTSEIKIELEK